MKIPTRTSLQLMRASRKVITCVVLSHLIVLPVYAQQSLNLKQALTLTLSKNAELKAYPLILRGAEAMQLQADFSPNPVLGVQVENAFGSGNFQSIDNAEISLTISQLVELGDKRKNRVTYANAKTQRLNSEFELTRLDILAETSRRYYQTLALQEQIEWIKRRVSIENDALNIISLRARAGAVGKADVSKMGLRLARSEILEIQLTTALEQSKYRLASMWMSLPKFTRLDGSLASLPVIPDNKMIVHAIDNLPIILNQLALQRLADSQLRLARSNGSSDINFSLGIKQHQLTSDQSLNLSFSMPLAFKNPNQGRILAAQAALDKSIQQTTWSKQQLKLTLLEIRQKLIGLKNRANSFKNKLLPKAKLHLEETEQGYQKGRYSVLQWVDAQSELFSIEATMINIHQQIYVQFLELERITGQPMTQTSKHLIGDK